MVAIKEFPNWLNERLDLEAKPLARSTDPLANARDRVAEAAKAKFTAPREVRDDDKLDAANPSHQWVRVELGRGLSHAFEQDFAKYTEARLGGKLSQIDDLHMLVTSFLDGEASKFNEGEKKPLEAAAKALETAIGAMDQITGSDERAAAIKALQTPALALRKAVRDFCVKADVYRADTDRILTKIDTCDVRMASGKTIQTVGKVVGLLSGVTFLGMLAVRMGALDLFSGRLPAKIAPIFTRASGAMKGLTPLLFYPIALSPAVISGAIWAGGRAKANAAAADQRAASHQYVEEVFVDRQVGALIAGGNLYGGQGGPKKTLFHDQQIRVHLINEHPAHPAVREALDAAIPEASFIEAISTGLLQ